jgi:hypothetical protein
MDLARSITDILGKGGAVSGLVGEVMKWLARERIEEADFTHCLNKTRALLYPNNKGLEIQNSLRVSDEKLRRNPFVAGLSLLGAGNIGRWMAQNPEYCYLATTVATLLTHHDMSYAASAICDMILVDEKQVADGTVVQGYALRKSQLLPVMAKIVESITLNVVNCGHDLGSLPLQLSDICGHTCDAHAFGTVTMTLATGSNNLIIRCKRFLVDVFMWTLVHVECIIELSIVGQIIYRKKTGISQRSLLFLVDEGCSCNRQQRSVPIEHTSDTITVSTSLEGDLHTLLEWDVHMENACGRRLSTRTALYDLGGSTGCSFGMLLPSEKRSILQASQNIVLWVLCQPVSLRSIDRRIMVYYPKTSETIVANLFSRWPRICNERFGGATTPATVVSSRKLNGQQNPHEILLEFQESSAAMEACSSRCSCPQCAHMKTESTPLPGCLKTMAGTEMLRMIAHAIADGFGADDVSGISKASAIETATSHILNDLLERKFGTWEQWFGLAAAVHLGCPITAMWPTVRHYEVVAVQSGSSVVIAPWIDLYSEVRTEGVFCFEKAQARLRGVDVDWAVLSTERTAKTGFDKLDLSEVKLPLHEYDEIDVAELSLQSTIQTNDNTMSASRSDRCRRRPDPFVLVTIAKIGRHTRIVDPLDVLVASGSSHIPQCTHDKSHKHVVDHSLPNRTWTCEEAVGFWEVENFSDTSGVWTYHTTTLDSSAKYNTLLALSPQGCVIKTADCCFACAVKESVTRFPRSTSKRILCTSMDEKSLTGRQR